jgi:hypothetical protein
MALIVCPDCGRGVSDLANACLQCGRPIAGQFARSDGLDPVPNIRAPHEIIWPAAAPSSPSPTESGPSASTELIASMWFCVALGALLRSTEAPPIAFLGSTFGVLAFALAVVLVTRPASADKINGGILVALNVIVFVVLVLAGK